MTVTMRRVQKISRKDSVNNRESSETIRQTPSRKEIESYFQGALHDASLNKGKRFRFTQNDRGWLEKLQQLLNTLGYRSWIYREGKNRSVYTLETLASFLNFSFDPTELSTEKEKRSYIRGFFDAEGGIPHLPDAKFYIQLVQKNKKKIESLKNILLSMGIDSGVVHNPSVRVDPNYWRVFIATRSHQRFARLIGSWHPRKAVIFARRMKI